MFLWFVLFSSAIALPDVTHLPDVHRQSVLCAKRIVAQYFDRQYPTAITYPRDTYKEKYTRDLKASSDRDILISDIIKELIYELFRDSVVWYVKRDYEFVRMESDLAMHFNVVLSDYDGYLNKIVNELFSMVMSYAMKNNLGNKTKLIVIFPTIYNCHKQEFLNLVF